MPNIGPNAKHLSLNDLVVGVVAEPDLDEYREGFVDRLRTLGISPLDLNVLSDWATVEELVNHATRYLLEHRVDFVALISLSGNGLQMLANKDAEVRAAPLLGMALVPEAVAIKSNMCDIGAATHSIPEATELLLALLKGLFPPERS